MVEPAATLQRVMGLSAAGFHHLSYYQWGDPDNGRVLICAHGLARNSRDFDRFAAALAPYYRVICPDFVGRGRSAWLPDPSFYSYEQYQRDAVVLLAAINADTVDWLGTSMGGLLGMMLAVQPQTPLRRLILNDIGPYIEEAALRRIADYLAPYPFYATVAEAERALRQSMASFGKLTPAQWRHLATHGVRPVASGYRPHYHYAIVEGFRAGIEGDIDLWPLWQAITIPTFVIHGRDSDVLSQEVYATMLQRPGVEGVVFEGVGHAPMLLDEAQIIPVKRWLLSVSG